MVSPGPRWAGVQGLGSLSPCTCAGPEPRVSEHPGGGRGSGLSLAPTHLPTPACSEVCAENAGRPHQQGGPGVREETQGAGEVHGGGPLSASAADPGPGPHPEFPEASFSSLWPALCSQGPRRPSCAVMCVSWLAPWLPSPWPCPSGVCCEPLHPTPHLGGQLGRTWPEAAWDTVQATVGLATRCASLPASLGSLALGGRWAAGLQGLSEWLCSPHHGQCAEAFFGSHSWGGQRVPLALLGGASRASTHRGMHRAGESRTAHVSSPHGTPRAATSPKTGGQCEGLHANWQGVLHAHICGHRRPAPQPRRAEPRVRPNPSPGPG